MSMLDFAESDRRGGLDGNKYLAGLHNQREQTNSSLKQQHKARQMSAIGSGIGTGMMAAATFGGPVGLGVGAAAMVLGGLF